MIAVVLPTIHFEYHNTRSLSPMLALPPWSPCFPVLTPSSPRPYLSHGLPVAAEFGLGTCLVAIVRGKMEAKLGGTDEGCYKNWWCVGCCCSPCAICQQQRAMHAAMASGVTVMGAPPGSEDMRR